MVENTIETATRKSAVAGTGSAVRMRRCRARRRAGFRCVMVEISNDEIAGLTRRGLLPEQDREDVGAIEAATYDLFEQTIGRPCDE